jgi:hypothetical protein
MFATRTIAGVLIWGIAASLAGAEPFVKITQPAGADGSGTSASSGTLVGWTRDVSRGIFLSCAHGYDAERQVNVEIDGRPGITGEVIAINREFDLSLVAAPCDRGQTIVKVARRPATHHRRVTLHGFPRGEFQQVETKITHRIWSQNACSAKWKLFTPATGCICPAGYQELWIATAAAPPGLSGGAVLLDDHLAGVVVGRISNADDAGLIVPAETVSLFIRRNIALFHVAR